MTTDITRDILERIEGYKDEMVDLVVRLGNLPSPTGQEGPVCNAIYDWFTKYGFRVRKIGLTEERFNVLATYKGTGNGYSLLFNGHMDQVFYEETDKELVIDAKKPAYGNAWVEDDKIFGYGVTNCKGPIVAFMMAGRAIKEAGVKLKGDLILAPSVGECEGEPIGEWKAPELGDLV